MKILVVDDFEGDDGGEFEEGLLCQELKPHPLLEEYTFGAGATLFF